MKPKLLLRVAAVSMLLHTAGHTIGALTWKQAPNSAVENVINGMEANHFEFMGREVTIASFYQGYGISMIFVFLFISLLLWMLAGGYHKPIIILSAFFLSALAIAEYIYFFPLPAAFSLVAALCCFAAGIQQKMPKPLANDNK